MSSIITENDVDCAVSGGVPLNPHEDWSNVSQEGRLSVETFGTSPTAAGCPSILTFPTSPSYVTGVPAAAFRVMVGSPAVKL